MIKKIRVKASGDSTGKWLVTDGPNAFFGYQDEFERQSRALGIKGTGSAVVHVSRKPFKGAKAAKVIGEWSGFVTLRVSPYLSWDFCVKGLKKRLGCCPRLGETIYWKSEPVKKAK